MEVENHGELKLEISLDNKTWHSVGVVKPMEDNVLVELSKNQSISITDDVQEQISSKLTPLLTKVSNPTDSIVIFDVSKLSLKDRLRNIKTESTQESTATFQPR